MIVDDYLTSLSTNEVPDLISVIAVFVKQVFPLLFLLICRILIIILP